MTGSLSGGRVLVVGVGTQPSPEPDAPTGNGRAIVRPLCSRRGAVVVCADRDEASACGTAELIRGEGGEADVVVGDVASEPDCAAIVAGAGGAHRRRVQCRHRTGHGPRGHVGR